MVEIVAISSIVIAILSLVLTVWQAVLTRQHNRLSVSPQLDWATSVFRNRDSITCSFVLKNAGIGPAIVTSRRFLTDGRTFESKDFSPAESIAELCFGTAGIRFEVVRHALPGVGTAVVPGQEICVAEFKFPGADRGIEPLIEKQLARIDFEIHYRSLYGVRSVFTTANSEHVTLGKTPARLNAD